MPLKSQTPQCKLSQNMWNISVWK